MCTIHCSIYSNDSHGLFEWGKNTHLLVYHSHSHLGRTLLVSPAKGLWNSPPNIYVIIAAIFTKKYVMVLLMVHDPISSALMITATQRTAKSIRVGGLTQYLSIMQALVTCVIVCSTTRESRRHYWWKWLSSSLRLFIILWWPPRNDSFSSHECFLSTVVVGQSPCSLVFLKLHGHALLLFVLFATPYPHIWTGATRSRTLTKALKKMF
jgi:hypothetical protein